MRRMLAGIAAFAIGAIWSVAHAEPASKDPYLWLEEINGARARTWVQSRNETTLGELRKDPTYRQTREAADQILSFRDVIPRDQVAGRYVFSFQQSAKHPFGLWRRTTMEAYRNANPKWETRFDLDAQNAIARRTQQWKGAKCLPPDFSRCLIILSGPAGTGVTVREYDADRGEYVPDGFEIGEAPTEVEWVDIDTLLVASNWGRNSLTSSGRPRIVKIWSRGQPVREAQTVYAGDREDVEVLPRTVFSNDGKVSIFIVRQQSAQAGQLFHVDESGRAISIAVPPSAQFKGMLQRQLLFLLNADWRTPGQNHAAGSVVSYSLDDCISNPGAMPQVLQAYIADKRSSVTGVAIASNAAYVTLLENVQGRMNELTFDGRQWLWRRVTLPDNGAVEVLSAGELGPEVLLKYSGFLTPDSLYVVERGREPASIRQITARFDASGAKVTQYEAISEDGTKVPYFIVRKSGFFTGGAAPTLLYAYGGFQISTTPWYWSSAGKLWLEKGGAYAIANIRGGGEFGPGWHAAAARENRQKNFDDLAAVARDMIARGLTTPGQLGLFGTSQGGLLVAGTFVQYPELFSAVVAQVPLTDMMRYTKLAASTNWVAEYGDPADPHMRDIIAQWSPYQNVRPGVKYPHVFLMSSTADSRIHPAHARKMAAKLQDLGQPVMYYEDGLGAEPGQRAEQLALTFTYFRRVLMD